MSTFTVPVVKLGKIGKHPNADNLSITQVEGCPCIVKSGDFQPGDTAVYVPIEAVVPLDKPCFSFLQDPNHLNRTHARIKAKKLRGIFSMGILVPAKAVFGEYDPPLPGTNVQDLLGIKKYVEPEDKLKFVTGTSERDPGFMPVYDVEHYHKNKGVIALGQEVVVTEKIHGCNGRWCFNKDPANPEAEPRLWVGSHNCIKRLDPEKPCIWWKVALDLGLEAKLKQFPGFVFYGEVYGQVQDLQYGTKPGEIKLAIFDVYNSTTGRFLDFKDAAFICQQLDLPMVPVLYTGPFVPETVEPLADGTSTLAKNIREGIVIKPTVEMWDRRCGRVILKLVSEAYLLRKNGTEAQ